MTRASRQQRITLAVLGLALGLVAGGLGSKPSVGLGSAALADTAAASSSAAPAGSGAAPDALPLPPLPDLEPIAHPPPKAQAVKELEGRLTQLADTTLDGPLDQTTDLSFLGTDADANWVPAVAQRIQELRGALDGGKAELLLEKARKAARRAQRDARRAAAKSGKPAPAEVEDDWLRFVLALERDDRTETWQQLVELYGMLRILEATGTTAAVREMIDCYSYFGELVRIDLQRAVARLKDRAVPALIEARKHDASRVRRWASRQLDDLGRAIPGEAVSTTDPEILADVLRAFGRTRDVDAARVVLSFCNSERVLLRRAAREALAAIGEPAEWQLRDAYQSLTGDKPPRSWSWDRTARELFRLHDRARLAAVYQQMDQGMAALGRGELREAVAAFDRVLARSPLFERRTDMVPAYAGYAGLLAKEGKRDEAIVTLRKALRLAPSSQDTTKLRSQLATLEGAALIEAGTPDRFLLRRAIELDPSNAEARQLLDSLQGESAKRQQRSQRYLAAVVVGVCATVAMVLLARRRRPRPAARRAAGASATGSDGPGPTSDELPTQELLPRSSEPPPRASATVEPPPASDSLPTRPVELSIESDSCPTAPVELDDDGDAGPEPPRA